MGLDTLVLRWDGSRVCLVDVNKFIPVHRVQGFPLIVNSMAVLRSFFLAPLTQIDYLSIISMGHLVGSMGYGFDNVDYICAIKFDFDSKVLSQFFLSLEVKYTALVKSGVNVGLLDTYTLGEIDEIGQRLNIPVDGRNFRPEMVEERQPIATDLSDMILGGVDGYLQQHIPVGPKVKVDKRDPNTYDDPVLARQYVNASFSTRVKDMIDIVGNVDHKHILAIGDGAGVCQVACRYLNKTCFSYDKSKVMCQIAATMGNTVNELTNREALLKHESESRGLCVVISHVMDFDPGLIDLVLESGYDLVVYEKIHLYKGLWLLTSVSDVDMSVRVSSLRFWKARPMRLMGVEKKKEIVYPYTDYYRSDKRYCFKEKTLLPHFKYFANLGYSHSLCYIGDDSSVIEYLSSIGITSQPSVQGMVYICDRDYTLPEFCTMGYCARLNKFFSGQISIVDFPVNDEVFTSFVYLRQHSRVEYLSGEATTAVINGELVWFLFGSADFRRYPDAINKFYYGTVRVKVKPFTARIRSHSSGRSGGINKLPMRSSLIYHLQQGPSKVSVLLKSLSKRFKPYEIAGAIKQLRDDGLVESNGDEIRMV